ncbi:MAG: response regulator [Gemmatimonadota bacterium]
MGQDLRERYHRLVDLAPDSILIHDGNVITMANAAALELAGAHDRSELVGLPVDSFLNPPYLKGLNLQPANPGREVRIPAVRDTFRRLDGSSVEVEVTAIPFVDHGRPAAHLVIRDITERLAVQLVEERLRRAEKMEAVGILAGGVAHEVNNMMVVVLGFSEMLLNDSTLSAEQVEDVRQIWKAGDRASTITRQLLSFSRRAIHQPAAIALDTIAKEFEPAVRRLMGENQALTVAFSCPGMVLVDRGQLEQVVVNLAINARDAMPDGGRLAVETSEVTLGAGVLAYAGTAIPEGQYGLVTVSDTGSGMDSVTLARIFEPFYTTKPFGQGTGLGLAAVYGIIKQNEGHIRVETAPGQGTTFSLYLPLTMEEVPAERRQEPRVPITGLKPGGFSVLIVDDEPAVLMIAGRILTEAGYRVLEAADGVIALEMISREGPPDLVLTDVMMPGIGGVELARRLKEPWPALPIVFMSGFSAEDLRNKGTIDMVALVLQKPFTPDKLVSSIASVLSPAQ